MQLAITTYGMEVPPRVVQDLPPLQMGAVPPAEADVQTFVAALAQLPPRPGRQCALLLNHLLLGGPGCGLCLQLHWYFKPGIK